MSDWSSIAANYSDLEGERVHSPHRSPQKNAYRKEKRTDPQGLNEMALYAYLETQGEISHTQAGQMLEGEIKLGTFLHRHEYTLALWWDSKRIISLRGQRS